jgi:hypothetical protein
MGWIIMNKDLLCKTIVIGIILLLISVGFQSAIAVDIPEKEEIEPKDYLFDTIIELNNHQDFQDILREYGYNIFTYELDNKYIFRNLLFKNPELLSSIVFTKTEMTSQYLEKVYSQGTKLVEIFGEEKFLELLDSVEISNPEIFNDMRNIVLNDKELSDRVSTLSELNAITFIICIILIIMIAGVLVKDSFFTGLSIMFINYPIVRHFFLLLRYISIAQGILCFYLMIELGCIDFY